MLREDLRQTATIPSYRVSTVFYLSTDLFIILILAGLAIWIAVGIFSSRLESEVVCPNCDTQGLPEMTRRGLKDVAVCQTCGFTLGGLPVVLKNEGISSESDGSHDA